MPAVCRIGDSWSCGDTQKEGSGTVFVHHLPVDRLGDFTAGHCFTPVPVIEASGSVFADGIGVARIGDPHPGHTCLLLTHGGNLSTGSGDVFADGA